MALGPILQAPVTPSSIAHLLKKPLIASSEGNLIELNGWVNYSAASLSPSIFMGICLLAL